MLGDPAVDRLERRVGEAGQAQLLGQAVLEGAEGAFGAAARLGRVGGDVGDAELGQRPADLGRLAAVDPPADRFCKALRNVPSADLAVTGIFIVGRKAGGRR